MKNITFLLLILSFFTDGCRKTKNTVSAENPGNYVTNMQGSYNWQGSQTDTNLSVPYNISSGTITNTFPITVINDSIIICNPLNSFIYSYGTGNGLVLDTFTLLSSSNVSKQIIFTATALINIGSNLHDTIIYNYKSKEITFNEYDPFLKWYRTLHTP